MWDLLFLGLLGLAIFLIAVGATYAGVFVFGILAVIVFLKIRQGYRQEMSRWRRR